MHLTVPLLIENEDFHDMVVGDSGKMRWRTLTKAERSRGKLSSLDLVCNAVKNQHGINLNKGIGSWNYGKIFVVKYFECRHQLKVTVKCLTCEFQSNKNLELFVEICCSECILENEN